MVYSFLTFFLLITAAEGFWLGSKEEYEEDNLSSNYRYFLGWPAVIGILRIFFWLAVYRIESPQFYLEKGGGTYSGVDLRKDLDKIYEPSDSQIIYIYLIKEFKKKSQQKKIGPSTMFTKDYRKRFAAG